MKSHKGKVAEERVWNRGTAYGITRIDVPHTSTGPRVYVLATTGIGMTYGEWVELWSTDSIAWTYLAETLPNLERFGSDKEGWIKAFAAIGIEVF